MPTNIILIIPKLTEWNFDIIYLARLTLFELLISIYLINNHASVPNVTWDKQILQSFSFANIMFMLRVITDIDDCQSHNCMNGGTCVDALAGYTCDCPEGTSDQLCQISTGAPY